MTFHFVGIAAPVAGGVLPDGGLTGGVGGFCADNGRAIASEAMNGNLRIGLGSGGCPIELAFKGRLEEDARAGNRVPDFVTLVSNIMILNAIRAHRQSRYYLVAQ